jgi:hypothetical protein
MELAGRLQKVFFSTIERRYDRLVIPKSERDFPWETPHDILEFLPDFEPIESTFRSVKTKTMLDRDIWGTHTRTGITIIPSLNLSWTLRMITILLNELDDTWSRSDSRRAPERFSSR